MANWCKLFCKKTELQLLGTLNGGQSFRWKKALANGNEQWIGIFSNKVWILEQKDDHILYQTYGPSSKQYEDNEKLLKDYFQLNLNLEDYYELWSKADPYFKEAAKQFYGVRILKQDVTENIFSFICSSNNNIARISSMVEKLCKFFGEEICVINETTYYTFPTVNALCADGVEEILKKNGFGYRAKYISKSAQYILEQGNDKWLENLKEMNYNGAKDLLMNLTGVGAKVADCICLMSLGHLNAIPVDTHIYQIASKFYMPKLAKQKTVTKKVYDEIGDYFRDLYGPLAGWAHTVLFCADLKKFKDHSTEEEYNIKKKKKK